MITGTYGSNETSCNIFTYGGWYVVEGSGNVNQTDEELLVNDVDVEELPDFDCFTWPSPITSEQELITAVEL